MKIVGLGEASGAIRSGDFVFVHTAAAAPQQLVAAMTARGPELRGVEVVHLHTEGRAGYVEPEHAGSFHTNSLFTAANTRDAIASGQADYVPIFLSEIPALFRR